MRGSVSHSLYKPSSLALVEQQLTFSTCRFLKQRPKILHFSGRGVGGAAVAAASDAAATDAGIQLADGVLASRDFCAMDLSRCMVVVLSCSWVSVEDIRGLPALVSALMAAGAWTVLASTCNVPPFCQNSLFPLQLTLCQGACAGAQRFLGDIVSTYRAPAFEFMSVVGCLLSSHALARSYRELLTGK
jgi:hypothetical protein